MAILYPDIVQLVNIGHSAEGREMVAMRISKGSGGSLKQKAGFVVTGAQHAREVCNTSASVSGLLSDILLTCACYVVTIVGRNIYGTLSHSCTCCGRI